MPLLCRTRRDPRDPDSSRAGRVCVPHPEFNPAFSCHGVYVGPYSTRTARDVTIEGRALLFVSGKKWHLPRFDPLVFCAVRF